MILEIENKKPKPIGRKSKRWPGPIWFIDYYNRPIIDPPSGNWLFRVLGTDQVNQSNFQTNMPPYRNLNGKKIDSNFLPDGDDWLDLTIGVRDKRRVNKPKNEP